MKIQTRDWFLAIKRVDTDMPAYISCFADSRIVSRGPQDGSFHCPKNNCIGFSNIETKTSENRGATNRYGKSRHHTAH